MAAKKDYFGWGYLPSLILCIIPITSCILGFITRLQEGRILLALIRLLAGWNIIWILDIIYMITSHRIFRIAK